MQSPEPTVRRRVHVPVTTAARIDIMLRDPIRPERRTYGAFSRLVSQLLADWLDRVAASSHVPPSSETSSEGSSND